MECRIQVMRDILCGQEKVEILSLYSEEVVRTITARNDDVHILCGDGSSITVPGDTALQYDAWIDDRGSILFLAGDSLKLCTEFDIVQLPSGERRSITIDRCTVPQANHDVIVNCNGKTHVMKSRQV